MLVVRSVHGLAKVHLRSPYMGLRGNHGKRRDVHTDWVAQHAKHLCLDRYFPRALY
jgi:hypothetical protein